jgi:hypothetical protein
VPRPFAGCRLEDCASAAILFSKLTRSLLDSERPVVTLEHVHKNPYIDRNRQ